MDWWEDSEDVAQLSQVPEKLGVPGYLRRKQFYHEFQ